MGGWGGPTSSGFPEARREGSCLPKHKSQKPQATSIGSTLGRAGKPQFITKMENDNSPHSSPVEGLIYDGARAWDICQCRAARTPSEGALIAVLLATGVKDALRIGYLLLFIITAHQPGSGAVRRRELAGARARPLPSRPPFLHPYLPPHHLLLFSSHLLGETGG